MINLEMFFGASLIVTILLYAIIKGCEDGSKNSIGVINMPDWIRITSRLFVLALIVGTFGIVGIFSKKSERVINDVTILGKSFYDIKEYEQGTDNLRVTFFNENGKEEVLFLTNYSIEYAEDPYIEIVNVRVMTKNIWWKFFKLGDSEEQTRYIVHMEIPDNSM